MIKFFIPMEINISIENILLAIFLFICIIILSIIPSGIIRVWVFSSAFETYSGKYVKKIRLQHTILQKMNLWYLIKYENHKGTKRRIIAYWIYWGIVILGAVMFSLAALGVFHYSATGFILFPLELFNIVIWIIWVQKGKRII